MADYREISQEYGKGAIKAALLINGGAAVALLSQAAELVAAGFTDEVSMSMISWALGTFASALAWIAGFLSTRYVDKSEQESSRSHLRTSNIWMYIALGLIASSLAAFLIGSVSLGIGFLSIRSTVSV